MDIQNQFYSFYRPYLNSASSAIRNGKVLIFVGINAIGKNILAQQIMSQKFSEEYFKNTKTHLIFLNFKDKYPPSSTQLYEYWIEETAKALKIEIKEKEEYNDFSFYYFLTSFVKNLKDNERIAFILLDAQQILNLNESFFRSLIFLHKFAYGKVSYILLSEPHILHNKNPWVQKFIQHLTGTKYFFLKTFDKKTTLANIRRQEIFLKADLKKYEKMICKYSRGLHGMIDIFCYILKYNPQIKNIRRLIRILYTDKLYQYWVKDVLDSLPGKSIRILKEISPEKEEFSKYKKDIYGRWLQDLGFVKKNGTPSYPLLLPVLKQYAPSDKQDISIRLAGKHFYINREKIKLAKKENLVLQLLYKNKDHLVTFENIANMLWPDDLEKYSLWAISQIVRRLRKRLDFYSLNPKIISSQRGEGYVLTDI